MKCRGSSTYFLVLVAVMGMVVFSCVSGIVGVVAVKWLGVGFSHEKPSHIPVSSSYTVASATPPLWRVQSGMDVLLPRTGEAIPAYNKLPNLSQSYINDTPNVIQWKTSVDVPSDGLLANADVWDAEPQETLLSQAAMWDDAAAIGDTFIEISSPETVQDQPVNGLEGFLDVQGDASVDEAVMIEVTSAQSSLMEAAVMVQGDDAEMPQVPHTSLVATAETLMFPVKGYVTQGFGCSPYYTGIAGPGCPDATLWFHDGVDLAVVQGTPVVNVVAGQVIFAGDAPTGMQCEKGRGYGEAVIIDGGEWQTLYAHLSEVYVATGQQVPQGTIIGLSGDTGCSTGAHLHWSLRHNGTLVDPQTIGPGWAN
jgi:murein DD-endopeptidase MepM/ murein hydrolase activator NlpD